MKLIIDIDDEEYQFIKDLRSLIIGGRGSCKTIQYNVINAIKNGTPVYEHERLKAEWIEDLSNYDNHYSKHIQDIFRCSICGFRNNRQTNYCPNCGADMRSK